MSTKKRNTIYYILYLLITTFLVSEIILRVFDPFGAEYLFEIAHYNTTFRRDPDFFYINQPGFSGEMQGIKIHINNEGLRSPEFDENKKTKKRLLILGDSIVFGWGVEQDSIFTYRLYNIFKDSIEIIGAGSNSWNTRAEYAYLKKRALGYKPDYMILIINPNDIYLKQQKQPQKEISLKNKVRKMLEKLASYSYTSATFLAFYQKYRYAKIINDIFDKTPGALTDARAATVSLIKICNKNNIKLVSFIYGNPQTEIIKKCSQFYKKIFNEFGMKIYFFKGTQLFSGKFTNSFIDGHPNAAGHQIITDQLTKTIRTLIK